MMMMPQFNYIYWVGHLAKSVKKPNLSKNLKSYWLVNDLCIVSKYVEKVKLEHLDRHMITHHLLPDYLPAYKKLIYQNNIG